MKIEKIDIKKIVPYANNAKQHPQWQVDQLKESIKKFGFNDPIAIDENNVIIEGHGRFLALTQLDFKEAEVIKLEHLTDIQKKQYIILHNQSTINTGFDENILKLELDEINLAGEDLEITGLEIDKINEICFELPDLNKYEKKEKNEGALYNKFMIPPFSVLESRRKEWLQIKNKWKELFDSKRGRKKDLVDVKYGTSEFDPAICEVFYKWYTPNKKAKILDPFCGGVVRGAVAEKLGFKYTGFDIREEQVKENISICKDLGVDPKYICSDSLEIDDHIKVNDYDLLFSCPPYSDLEVYSDLKNDLSNMNYKDFIDAYNQIIKKSCDKLKDNRFAIFVVGEIRDKEGEYLDFIGDTIRAFKGAGLKYYNQLIYKEPNGTAPIRCAAPFNKNRKITKIHQNILIFYKGELNKIQENFDLFYEEEEIEEMV